MTRAPTLLFLIATALQGCGTMFLGADRRDLAPITVSGAIYQIYELRRSVDLSQESALTDPNATVAIYARVGAGATVYCGPSVAGCERAISEFNNNERDSEETM